MSKAYVVVNGQPIEVCRGTYDYVRSWLLLNGAWAREVMTRWGHHKEEQISVGAERTGYET